ncbi:MAG: methylmalonyl Co-A mutase-associated GTPase MeaB [Candidatus Micrarchaeota archaeon]|nr:methylmalonyl Co-A mutase-associated GTPase MeaB [Candidatus Micrarchaeota archaeon]MDE1864573.1 methylmalonyl Co-A mutase-associated GTPase MeaB [Candidatus Micrarchaeota archaeon]
MPKEIVSRILPKIKAGDRLSLGRAMTLMEENAQMSRELIKSIFRETGKAIVIGVTGPGGAGKSTLINELAVRLQKGGHKVAVLAVDPTSHITGGAFLGDRARMSLLTDCGVYMRSIGSRGATGAVSASIRNMIRLADYAGYDLVVVESVGAGQTEVDISKIADITAVVLNPKTGDQLQMVKAGLTEIGDIYVVNKGDLEGASMLLSAVRDYICDSKPETFALKTSAKTGTGIPALIERVEILIPEKRATKPAREKEMLKSELSGILSTLVRSKVSSLVEGEECAKMIEEMTAGKTDIVTVAEKIYSQTGL